MNMKRLTRAGIVVGTLLFLLPAAALADHEIGVAVTGEATIQPQLANQLELWMTRTGHKLVASPLAPDAVNAIIDCFVIDDESCARGVFEKRSKSPSVLYARADVQAGSTAMERDVTITAYWFQRGDALIQKKKRCEHCNEEKLRAAADELAAELATATGKIGHLKCTSNPVGADVSLGDRKIGVTPLNQPLAPGNYKITVTHVKHGVEARDVTVVAGETVNLDLALRVDDGLGHGGKRSRTPAIGVLVTGVAMLASGVVLIAVDEDFSTTGQQKPRINDSAPAGVGLAISGVVVAGIGAYLFVRKPARRSSPVGAVTPSGGYIGWATRF
jgi:hypothetical protein